MYDATIVYGVKYDKALSRTIYSLFFLSQL